MPRIRNDIPQRFQLFLCDNCGRTIEYTESEVKPIRKSDYDYGGGTGYYTAGYGFQCPACNNDVYVRR